MTSCSERGFLCGCRFAAAGQSHVFQWYDEGQLTPAEADCLYEQLAVLDLPRINKLFTDTMKAKVRTLYKPYRPFAQAH